MTSPPASDHGARAPAGSARAGAPVDSGIPKLPYLPGLDGVRAVAVVAVLLFHLPDSVLPGGFLGVDVFFVLSGFLITSLILGELETSGRLGFGAFYARRARRLLPALMAVLIVTAVLVLTVARDAAATFRHDVVAALTYTTNWWYILDDRSYFEVLGRPPMLQHLWSLAIEEQFYLVWPTVAVLAWRQWGRRGVGIVAVVGAVASTALMAGLAIQGDIPAAADSARLYFGSDTHAMTVLVGAALAVVWRPGTLPRQIPRTGEWAVAGLGLAALGGLLAIFAWGAESDAWLYRGGFLGVALLSAALVTAASHPGARFGVLFGAPVLRWLGTRSYGIYLWHWPIFLVTRPDLDVPLRGWWSAASSLALTFVVAEASYRWLEMPIRRGALHRGWQAVRAGSRRARVEAIAVAGLAVTTVVAGGVALAAVPAVDSRTYLGGVTEAGAGDLTPKPDDADGSQGGNKHGGQDGGGERHENRPLEERRITAVGDSVLLGARGALRDQFPRLTVDAKIGRQPAQIGERIRERVHVNRIGDVLIIQTGTNGTPDPQGLRDLLADLSTLDRVVIMTVRSPVPWEEQSNAIIERAAHGLDHVVVADWARTSVGHREYFEPDGTHLTPEGQVAYARLVLEALRDPDPGATGSSG